MGIMVYGIETTDEDLVIYDEEVAREIDLTMDRLALLARTDAPRYEVRAALEALVWRAVRRFA